MLLEEWLPWGAEGAAEVPFRLRVSEPLCLKRKGREQSSFGGTDCCLTVWTSFFGFSSCGRGGEGVVAQGPLGSPSGSLASAPSFPFRQI